jgi:hypothetical protein
LLLLFFLRFFLTLHCIHCQQLNGLVILSNTIFSVVYFHSIKPRSAEQTSQKFIAAFTFIEFSVRSATSEISFDLYQKNNKTQHHLLNRVKRKFFFSFSVVELKDDRVDESNMVNVSVDPLSDHVGYHILHWIVSQSGAWYSKVNENFQDNLRTFETGVAVIDDILTPRDDEVLEGNRQLMEEEENPIFQHNGHINMLNQIIDMNINYERGNDRNVRGNRRRPSGKVKFYFLKKNRCKIASHMLDRFPRSRWRIRSINSPSIDFSICFVLCAEDEKERKKNGKT